MNSTVFFKMHTFDEGRDVLINAAHVSAVIPMRSGTKVLLQDGSYITVRQTVADFEKTVERANQ